MMKYVLYIILCIFFSVNIFASEKNEIKFAYFEDFFPFSFKKNGDLEGIFLDSTKYILEKKLHYKVTSDAFPWERAQVFVQKNEYDAHVTSKNPAREKFLLFSKVPVYVDFLVIVYSKDNAKINEIKKIKSKEEMKKFVINDYIGNGLMKSAYPKSDGFNINLSSNLKDAFFNLSHEKGDIIITQKTIADVYIKRDSEKNLKRINADFFERKNEFLFCIRKNYPDAEKIVELFDKTLQNEIKNKNIQKLYDKKMNYYIKNRKE